MEETDPNPTRHDQSLPSSSSSSSSSSTSHVPTATTCFGDVSALSSRPSTSQVQEEQQQQEEEESDQPEDHPRLQQRRSIISYRATISQAVRSEMRDDVWSCLVLLVTFWLFASMTLIMGLYGSSNLQLGPNCSRLIQTNPIFVQSIKVEEQDEAKPGPILYGFYKPPPMDVEINWTEMHNTSVPTNSHKEWIYFLNTGSRIDVLFNVKSPSSPPLLLVIAQGRESLVEWIEDPSYPNTTLSWNIIHGSGNIEQEITRSSSYYIAVGNLNSEEVEIELEFKIKAFLYNTTQAYYQCFVGNSLCSLKLSILGAKTAVLTSPPHEKDSPAGDDWFVKLSYGPQWLTYFIGSGLMTVIMLLAFRFCSRFQNLREFQPVEVGAERAPLLLPKDDDASSWGSSYDSVSNDEEDPREWQVPESSLEGKATNEGENNSTNNNPRRLCIICYDSPRDCFFLPCGHCAACFTCGTRIAEEDGQCPICRRKMKKVRKIFTV